MGFVRFNFKVFYRSDFVIYVCVDRVEGMEDYLLYVLGVGTRWYVNIFRDKIFLLI